MRNMPRILPLVGVSIAGVLAINALAGARDLPSMLSGAKAFAEGVAKPAKMSKADKAAADKASKSPKTGDAAAPVAGATDTAMAATGDAVNTAALLPAAKPVAVCAPTAAELAKEAGLSPAELQVLQSLGARRGQLDKREQDMDVQLALLAAAEAKLDAKVKALTGLKADIQGLVVQADTRQQAEVDRLVKVFEGMKAKDAAPRMVLLDDSVRLPIAAKMKERVLSAIIAQMPPAEAKRLTESLARRYSDVKTMAAAADAPTAAAPAASAPAKPSAKGAAKAPGKQAAGAPGAPKA
jgi:flagellar motility protein MotE (MotC chaperone)